MEIPFCCDYAKSSRSVCRGCQRTIAKDTLRLAIMLQSTTFDSKVPNWYHYACFFIDHMPRSTLDISDFKLLRCEDQNEIKAIIEKGESPFTEENVKQAVASLESKATCVNYSIGYSKTSNCSCAVCDNKIKKNEVVVIDGKKKSKLLRYHFECFRSKREEIGFLESVGDMTGYEELSEEDKAVVNTELPGINEEVVPKKPRLSNEKLTVIEEKIMEETTKRDEYRDELKALTKNQLELLLKHNKQDTYRLTMNMLLERTSEMLTYGALPKCPKCKRGNLVPYVGGYRCSKTYSMKACSGMIENPSRTPVQVPEELKILFPFLMVYDFIPATGQPELITRKTKNLPLNYLNFNIIGFTPQETSAITNDISALGGRVVKHIKRSVLAVVTTKEELENRSEEVKKAEECHIYMVSRDYVNEVKNCTHIEEAKEIIKKFDMSPWGLDLHNRVPVNFQKNPSKYLNRPQNEEENKRKVIVKSGLAIEPDTGLADIAHVYVQNNDRFTAVLSRTNVTSNKNSYYKIQLLEADDLSMYWLYRAWGRIGTDVGSFSIKPMPDLHTAKQQFYETFEERTGNSWRMRRSSGNPGKFIYIETDYEANINEISLEDRNLENHIAGSNLHPAVAHLIAMVFNVHSMKQLLLEYSWDTQKMPLGKLSKYQIKLAYTVLNELITLIPHKDVNQRLIVKTTDRFYSLMPHNSALRSPPILDNMDIIKKKLEMLESLYEVETAYCIIQRNVAGQGNVLDAYYEQLCTDMKVLESTDEEYKLIQTYVINTHGPTHDNYKLEILEVFKVSRRVETERYTKYSTLHNRKLLWHGSRTTNFAGILSQGLRIAPPEAPVNGYMFGRGVYFADMVTKSANYCAITRENQTREGLLLLCEVALGDMFEKRKQFNAKNLRGCHSVKGLGRTYPDSQYEVTLPDGVVVPLGKPITDENVQTSLIYNEYIVYDEAQVKVRYLLKVKFNFIH